MGAAVFSDDGARVHVGHADRRVRTWSVETGELLVEHPETPQVSHLLELTRGTGRFAPEKQRLVSGSDQLRLFDPETGDLVSDFPPGAVQCRGLRARGGTGRLPQSLGHPGRRSELPSASLQPADP